MGEGLVLNGVDLGDPSAPLPDRVGAFTLHGRLGRSKGGILLDATNTGGVRVALKLARPPAEANERREETARLLRELAVLKALHHPGVIRLVDAGLVGGLLYLAVQRIEGVTLRVLLHDDPCDFDVVAAVGVHVGSTLAYLHEVGVLQRELTPDVIIIDREGHPVLADFGFSVYVGAPAITEPGPPSGMLGYVAPELFESGSASPSSDQYALGRLLFELCAPAARSSIRADQATPSERQSSGWVDWGSFPTGAYHRSLKRVLERMLAVDAGQRYADVHAAVAEIAQLAALKGLVAPHRGGNRPARPRSNSGAHALQAFVDHVKVLHDDDRSGEIWRSLSDSFSDVGAPIYATNFILIPPEDRTPEQLLALLRRQTEAFFEDRPMFEDILAAPEDSGSTRLAEELRNEARTYWEGRAKEPWTDDVTPIEDDPEASTAPGSDTIFDATPVEMMSADSSTEEGSQTISDQSAMAEIGAWAPVDSGPKDDGLITAFRPAGDTQPPGFLPVPDSISKETRPIDPNTIGAFMEADTLSAEVRPKDPANAAVVRAPSVYAMPVEDKEIELVDVAPPRNRQMDVARALSMLALLVVGLLVGYLLGNC